MSPEGRRQPTWVHWAGRAHQALNLKAQSEVLFGRIAGQYHFYGQLAAEELGESMPIPAIATASSADELAEAANNPGFARALRFYQMGLRMEGNREWNFQLRTLSDRQLLAAARFAIYGTKVYPDATFTLRLSFGQAKGYVEGGRRIPWTTRLGGAYQHAAEHQNREPFQLPESWTRNKDRLDLNTPFNFVSTADIIGGNSGSPVVNRAGEVVGIIFDGNIYSLVLDLSLIHISEPTRPY